MYGKLLEAFLQVSSKAKTGGALTNHFYCCYIRDSMCCDSSKKKKQPAHSNI